MTDLPANVRLQDDCALPLFSQAIVAIDGSKFNAVNNRDKNFTSAKMERRKQKIEDSIDRYLAALNTADQEESVTDAQITFDKTN